LEQTLAGVGDVSPRLRTKALGAASILASFQGEFDDGTRLAQEAVDLAERSGDEAGRAWGLLHLSFADRCRGNHQASAAYADAALEASRGLDDDPWSGFILAIALNRVGHEAYEAGRWTHAEATLNEALDRWRRLCYPWGIGMALAKLAPEDRAFIDALVRETLARDVVLARVRAYFKRRTGGGERC
jgi:tetratricopeptide (TPR) repeat protein